MDIDYILTPPIILRILDFCDPATRFAASLVSHKFRECAFEHADAELSHKDVSLSSQQLIDYYCDRRDLLIFGIVERNWWSKWEHFNIPQCVYVRDDIIFYRVIHNTKSNCFDDRKFFCRKILTFALEKYPYRIDAIIDEPNGFQIFENIIGGLTFDTLNHILLELLHRLYSRLICKE